jgi:hypothetical protein
MPNSTDKRRPTEGITLTCRSGTKGRTIRLRNRYDNDIEQLRSYNEVYRILHRLGIDHMTPEGAWELNPLTIGTVYPGDLQIV